MTEQWRPRGDDDIDRRLTELGPLVVFPPTPELVGSVASDLARPAPSTPLAAWGAPPRQRGWLVALAAVALLSVVVALLTLVPAARTSVAEALGVAGVRIFRFDAAPTVAPSPVGGDLRLGRRLTLTEAQAAVPYPIAAPALAGFDEPDEVYLYRVPKDGMISFVYRPRSDLPATAQTDVGALLTQFPGRTDRPLATKGVGPTATVESLSVRGGRGFWIEGDAHVFAYFDSTGEIRYDEYRLAGNVLLWEEDGLTYRLESALSKRRATEIADSMRAIDRTG